MKSTCGGWCTLQAVRCRSGVNGKCRGTAATCFRAGGDDGRELLYLHQFQLTGVEISETEPFRLGVPERLFDMPPELTSYELASNGRKFLFAVPEAAGPETPIAVVVNWLAGLK
jgi:hypothetical protein